MKKKKYYNEQTSKINECLNLSQRMGRVLVSHELKNTVKIESEKNDFEVEKKLKENFIEEQENERVN